MFLLWFLVPLCYADPSILLIGGFGDKSAGSIEKFDPNTMTSDVVVDHNYLLFAQEIYAAPVNNTHAIISVDIGGFGSKVYYIDRNGQLNPRPLNSFPFPGRPDHPAISTGSHSAIASFCDANGRRQVIRCFCKTKRVSCMENICEVLSEDGSSKYHSTMATQPNPPGRGIFSLTAFGKELIAIRPSYDGDRYTAERYNGSKWSVIKEPPEKLRENSELLDSCSTAVKLNDAELLVCGNRDGQRKPTACYVYNLDNDTWVEGPKTKSSVCHGRLAMVGKTVFAFGGPSNERTSSDIQTLDVSHGINGTTAWQMQSAKLEFWRAEFGVWVLDGSHECPITDNPTIDTASGSMVAHHLIGLILMALLVFA